MPTPSPTRMTTDMAAISRDRMLIVGGGSDIARFVGEHFSKAYDVVAPGRAELDITSRAAVEAYFAGQAFDVVLNCAGSLYECEILESDPEQWINDISVNLIGCYLVSRAAVLGNQDVLLVNLSSTAAFNAYSNWSSYCISKMGVVKLHAALFKSGCRIVTLCPGAIDTKFRRSTGVINPNVMALAQGCQPVIDAIEGRYASGDVVFYRKDSLVVNPPFLVDGV